MTSLPSDVDWLFSHPTPWGTAWGSFEYHARLQVEDAFCRGLSQISINCETGGIHGQGVVYDVDLDNMTQINTTTGFLRCVRRIAAATSVPPGEVWEHQGSDGIWVAYDTATCEHIRIARAAGKTKTVVHMENCDLHSFELDFTACITIDRRSGERCAIRHNNLLRLPSRFSANSRLLESGDEAHNANEVALAENCTDLCSHDEICAICLEGFDESLIKRALRLRYCGPGHYMHSSCILQTFAVIGPKCPTCNVMYGIIRGDQPDGTMTHLIYPEVHCAGYPDVGTIIITYEFPSGLQGGSHPNPGRSYSGTVRCAYLPNNVEGHEILTLLKRAFDRRLVFTIGTSITTGRRNTVVWNGIHHKTNITGGSAQFGYPDETYFDRVKAELALKGVV